MAGGNRFVVQKHNASHLHYDFRLEMDGVLKSWAIPKGPSLNPADKRLAVQVGDHSLSYFDFEGIIKAGYGAGQVMVWDVGVWYSLDGTSLAGNLKFRLEGKKLNGEFTLIRLHNRPKDWLLIKKHDEFATSSYNIDDFDGSVLTQRNMAEIAAGDRFLTTECG
jgi:bifunctional non-homologous end joining protein LigD